MVDQFFSASKLRDKTALQKIATVAFEPSVQGIVERFEISSVSPEENQTKTVTVAATVKLPDGAMAEETIVLTLSRGLITGVLSQKRPPPPRP